MNYKNLSKEITENIKEIISPYDLLKEVREISDSNKKLNKQILGYSSKNNPIELYEIGNGKKNILLYGFPDPSESIGGTSILFLIKYLLQENSLFSSLDIKWLFIPCLNFDDQPNNGMSLEKTMKTSSQEVDWCLNNPREETKALVNLAQKYKPILSFPLHDEYHCNEIIPIYFPVIPRLNKNICNKLREVIYSYNLEIDTSYNDKDMGQGFFEMSEIADDYDNSTFSVLSNYGNVIIFELSDLKHLEKKVLCEIQIHIILLLINELLLGK
ncbi:MAG: hypothetical protein U0354_20065 [Candidatus Sericytochromatia bacterium]